MKKPLFLLFLFFICFFPSKAENCIKPSTELLSGKWKAEWVGCPDVSPYDYGVYHFRKSFDLTTIPDTFVINLTADNRYRLFINGQPISSGPARGDVAHWYYDTVDLRPYLKTGTNVMAIQVWNAGNYTPGAQMTLKTGLIVQGNDLLTDSLTSTPKGWKVLQNTAFSPNLTNRQDVGCADIIDGSNYPWGWELQNFDDSSWGTPISLGRGQSYGSGTGYDWVLYPRDIPAMEEMPLRMEQIRRTSGIQADNAFLQGKKPLIIPAYDTVSILIDQTYLTSAYPEILVSGGRASSIRLSYAEALFKNGRKGNRNDTDGFEMRGWSDTFYPDGGSNRLYRPLWFRTYRYIQLDIITGQNPLTVHDLQGQFTAYPFRENGSFQSNEPLLDAIWETGWRTARLCAHETYFDCPYYEQLQYVGDTRIQALISLYVDGDDRLMRKAIRMFDWSRSPEGITTSRYPSRVPQYIPPFSLYWINMVHDYQMHRDDPEFVRSCMPGVRSIAEWFLDKIDPETDLLGPLPHWNFVDWPKEWPWNNEKPLGGVPPGGMTGGSAILSLQLAYTLNDVADLCFTFGMHELGVRCLSQAQFINNAIRLSCWDNERQLLKDDPSGTSYSQHANIMGILSGAIPEEDQQALFDRIVSDSSLIQATFYYRFYLFRALNKTGLADRYTEMLQPWQDMLSMGLTTFAENPEPTRSDCHAWSASPLYDFLATICGITPGSEGFKTVQITPHPGKLQFIRGKVPHPDGLIELDLKQTKKGLEGQIILPSKLKGIYSYRNKTIELHEGINEIRP